MIRVRYAPAPDLTDVQVVSVETTGGPVKIGYVRHDFLGTWIARPRPGIPNSDDPVRAFRSRTGAATWLPTAGGFAKSAARSAVTAQA
jgi:hypothetical protein